MCGICGKYNFGPVKVLQEEVKKMCSAIIHRGPDDEGFFIKENFGFGMRRLSIIDLDTGHQPICNEDASIWTVLNGEIYNYKELTEDLIKKGHQFKTKSDTEVLVHLYEEYGYDFVKHLRGMFGLAIWDTSKKELLLARDPLGIKQLYYFVSADEFIFGSEIKCILALPRVTPAVNQEALSHYFTFLYFPEQFTAFQGIEKVLPGTLVSVTNGNVVNSRYWNLNSCVEEDIGFEKAQKKFMELMNETINLHLRSDVPLGVFLSGGIDSSIVTALASKLVSKPLNTFTIGYGKEGKFYDEREYARIVAKRFNTIHHEFEINPDIERTIHTLIYSFDEPFANSSAIPNYHISRVMRENVKVALSGLGGDEVAAGYERYAGMRLLLKFRALPNVAKSSIRAIASTLPDAKDGSYFSNRLKRFARAMNLSENEAYFSFISGISHAKKSLLLNFLPKDSPDSSYNLFLRVINSSLQENFLNRAMQFDLVSYTTNDLLVLTDRTSMAHSLEVRVPFLDHKLVEFMFTLPAIYKLQGLSKKHIFKRAFKGILPDEILFRRKRGFSTPLSVWIRNDLREFCNNVFSEKRVVATEILNYKSLQQLFNEHLERKANYQGVLFAALTFILWHERYIQRKMETLEVPDKIGL